ncbi:MAG: type II secretion system protein J [Candidatus Methylacidiphilales bacterium]|nr:prepilin-type N-terminal cleavage/methylation domain-containing protein [Candidatus Methylacidiphilales bacterium]
MSCLLTFRSAKLLILVTRLHPGLPARCGERRGTHAGFTLAEMLVAMAVLAVIMVMLGQISQTVSQAWLDGQRKVNNFTKARAMLDMFARDVQGAVFRPDLAVFPGSDTIFYTRRPGVPSTSGGVVRNVSLVRYSYNTDQSTTTTISTLQRGDMAIPWNATASTIPFGNTTDFGTNTPTSRDTAPGVINYKVLFIYADGTNSLTYTASTTNPVRAIGLTLAVVDDQSLKFLSLAQVLALRTALDANCSGTTSVKADWEKYLASGLPWNSYPKRLGVGFKIFERYVILSN